MSIRIGWSVAFVLATSTCAFALDTKVDFNCTAAENLEPAVIPSEALYNPNVPLRLDPGSGDTKARLQVEVQLPSGVPAAKVGQVKLVATDGKAYAFTESSEAGVFEAVVPPGEYVLGGAAEQLVGANRKIALQAGTQRVTVHVAEQGTLFLRFGSSLVPFKPRFDLANIGFEYEPPAQAEVKRILDALAQNPELQGYYEVATGKDLPDEIPPQIYDAVYLRVLKQADWVRIVRELRDRIPKELKQAFVRIGVPISAGGNKLNVLDRRFLVKFSSSMASDDQQRWLDTFKAKKLRALSADPDLWLIEFSSDDPQTNLAAIECGFRKAALVVGEPDLQFQLIRRGLPATWPDDARYFTEQYTNSRISPHRLQMVREAWELVVETPGSSRPRGIRSTDLAIGFLDDAFSTLDPELDCTGADGNPQIVDWVDAIAITHCPNPGPACQSPSGSGSHGRTVLGVAMACADNQRDVAGIAIGLHAVLAQVAMDPHSLSVSQFSEIMMWLAGRASLCTAPGTPQRCLPAPHPGARIINGSYGSTLLTGATSTAIETTFQVLTRPQGGQPPVVLIYSVENSGKRVQAATELFAGSPYTIAVANCTVQEEMVGGTSQVRVRIAGVDCWEGGSNWGDKIDICALGHNVPAVSSWCSLGPQIQNETGGNCPARPASCTFGGTSAAAPTVSAAIALMLAANPNLTPEEIRQILRQTATRDVIATDGINLPAAAGVSAEFQSGRSNVYGSGLLNVCRAVAAALVKAGRPVAPNACD